MKKSIAIALACVALTASPALAGYSSPSAWEVIDGSTTTAKQLVLIGGLADELDACGNGKPFYTVFMPTDEALDALLDEEGTSVAELSSTPAVVTGLLNDHISRGSVSPAELENSSVTVLISASGFRLTKTVTDQVDPQVEEGEVYIAGLQIVGYEQVCNGVVYWLAGVVDSRTQVPTTGVNTATTVPEVTTESGLPDTL
jgi:uncharacterized surface protein with fasciclin (FAS1) repeats